MTSGLWLVTCMAAGAVGAGAMALVMGAPNRSLIEATVIGLILGAIIWSLPL